MPYICNEGILKSFIVKTFVIMKQLFYLSILLILINKIYQVGTGEIALSNSLQSAVGNEG